MPEELQDSELCEAYGWTWQQLQETPFYVRRAFWLIQQMKAEQRRKQQEKANAEMG